MKLTIEVRAKRGKFRELDQTLRALIPTIRNEKECRDCRIYRDLEDEEIIFFFIQCKTRERLEHYMQSSSGGALLGAIELLTEKAAVKIGDDDRLEGIDSLKRMRTAA